MKQMIDFNRTLQRNPNTHSPTHPDSYYAATVNDRTQYPTLIEDTNADVCVIGGGFSGVNTALELSEAGLSVVLLEARQIAWGASGRNGGQLLRGIGQNNEKFLKTIGKTGIDTLEKMGDEAVDIVRQRIQKFSIQCDLKNGSTMVALKQKHVRWMAELADELTQIGYPHSITLTSQNEIEKAVGSTQYIGALTLGGDAHVHPLNLCLGEARSASTLGAKLYENSPVVKITEGKRALVKTENGRTVSADFIVLCGNAYMENMHPKLTSKILPAGSYIIATEKLDKVTSSKILPLDTAVTDLNYALDYYRLSADRRLLFGGLCNYSGVDPTDISKVLRKKMCRIFPSLSRSKIEYQWGGMIGVGINRLPQIGRIGHNVYYAQGYAGHGVNATHMAAKLIAESITQQSHRIDLFEKIKHHTFPGGKNIQSALFALGMSYFRLKDLL